MPDRWREEIPDRYRELVQLLRCWEPWKDERGKNTNLVGTTVSGAPDQESGETVQEKLPDEAEDLEEDVENEVEALLEEIVDEVDDETTD